MSMGLLSLELILSSRLSVVRSYTGHGVGKLFHGAPNNIPHYAGNKTPGFMKVNHSIYR
jgi:methionyl aminopeptidase